MFASNFQRIQQKSEWMRERRMKKGKKEKKEKKEKGESNEGKKEESLFEEVD